DGIRDDLVTGVQTCALPICFGHDGIATTYVGGIPVGIAQETDGKIVFVLQYDLNKGALEQKGFVLTRYNMDGTVDASFGTGGIVDRKSGRVGKECRSGWASW